MSNSTLRAAIIEEMKRYEEAQTKIWNTGKHFHRERYCVYPTWWFKHKINCATNDARRELKKMEVEGLVTANREYLTNLRWLLVQNKRNQMTQVIWSARHGCLVLMSSRDVEMMKNADQLRKSELAQIHIAKVQLNLDDTEYRALLLQVTGKTSSKDLTWQGRKTLLDHFKKLDLK